MDLVQSINRVGVSCTHPRSYINVPRVADRLDCLQGKIVGFHRTRSKTLSRWMDSLDSDVQMLEACSQSALAGMLVLGLVGLAACHSSL